MQDLKELQLVLYNYSNTVFKSYLIDYCTYVFEQEHTVVVYLESEAVMVVHNTILDSVICIII